jgi:ABC-type transporter Mla MlaB component
MSMEARAPEWRVAPAEGGAALAMSGDWIAQSGLVPAFPADGLAKLAAHATLAFGMSDVGRWDSGLIAFLWDARRAADASGIAVDDGALPEAAPPRWTGWRRLFAWSLDSAGGTKARPMGSPLALPCPTAAPCGSPRQGGWFRRSAWGCR